MKVRFVGPVLFVFLSSLLSPFLSSAQEAEIDFSYLDYNLSFEKRADILLAQMSLEEKIGQMMNDANAIERLKIPQYNWWNECLRVARAIVQQFFLNPFLWPHHSTRN
ncbi:MAG: hypothetical protein R2784_18595 [Saprospiraceae bacterium]